MSFTPKYTAFVTKRNSISRILENSVMVINLQLDRQQLISLAFQYFYIEHVMKVIPVTRDVQQI
jgi:hypothetical protein